MLTEKYARLVYELYAEPKDQRIMGSFLNPVAAANIIGQTSDSSAVNKRKCLQICANRDIRAMMNNNKKREKTRESENPGVIELE